MMKKVLSVILIITMLMSMNAGIVWADEVVPAAEYELYNKEDYTSVLGGEIDRQTQMLDQAIAAAIALIEFGDNGLSVEGFSKAAYESVAGDIKSILCDAMNEELSKHFVVLDQNDTDVPPDPMWISEITKDYITAEGMLAAIYAEETNNGALTVAENQSNRVQRAYCGPDAYYVFTYKTGELQILGSGEITSHPWKANSDITDYVKAVYIGKDITDLGSNVVTNGKGAFRNLLAIETVVFEEGSKVSVINASEFHFCENMTSIILPDNLQSIGSYAFYNCNNLNAVTLPKSVIEIGEYAFYQSNSLHADFFGDISSYGVSYNAFSEDAVLTFNCDSKGWPALASKYNIELKHIFNEGVCIKCSIDNSGNIIMGSCGNDAVFKLNAKTGEMVIEGTGSISGSGFSDYAIAIKNVEIKPGITEIGLSAFRGASNLKTVLLPEGLINISYNAFSQCVSLNSINLPTSLISIESDAFYACFELNNVTLPVGLKRIGSRAFCHSGIEFIEIPEGVSEIGTEAFYYCQKLSYVKIPTTLKIWGVSCFEGCINLTKVELPDTMTTIPGACFSECTNLKTIVFPKSLTEIGYDAFYRCESLFSETGILEIPQGVTTVNQSAFYGCKGIKTLIIPESILVIKDSAFSGISLLLVNFEGDVPALTRASFASDAILIYDCQAEGWVTEADEYYNVELKHTYSEGICIKCGTAEDAGDDTGNSGEENPDGTNINDKVYYTFDSETGALKIFGQGAVINRPWRNEGWTNQIKSLEIGSKITEMPLNADFVNLASIHVEEGNQYYSSVDGVLYDANQTILYHYPRQRAESVLNVPQTVKQINGYAFYYCHNIKTVNLPATVTYVGPYTFYNCQNLTSLGGAANFSYIGNRAFYNCKSLESINLFAPENGKAYIGSVAFYHCDSLKKISIPSVESIYYRTFQSCLSLEEVTIADGLEYIGSQAFRNCRKLKTINIPDGVTEIADRAFRYCTSLENVVLPQTLSYLGMEAFYHCDSFTEIVAPGINYIPSGTFQSCLSLEHVVIGRGASTIGYEAFRNCKKLKSISIPDTVETIDSYAFMYCSSLQDINFPDSIEHIGYWAFSRCHSLKTIEIPGIEIIESGAFMNCDGLEAVTILEGTEELKQDVFESCSNLKTVILPDTVKVIDNWAFSYCEKLENITMPTALNYLGRYAFQNCKMLNEITVSFSNLSEGTILEQTFWNCDALETVTLNNVKKINDSAFYHCDALTTVNMCDGITNIGNNAFGFCKSLKTIKLPDTVTYIGNIAFRCCEALEAVKLPGGLETIGNHAFLRCSSLKEITIPDSVTYIGYGAFRSCNGLTTVELPNGITELCDNTFENCLSLKEIELPEGVTSIGAYAFRNCLALQNVVLPENVTDIGAGTFRNCSSLEVITLPINLTQLGGGAFAGTKLTNIELPAALTEIGPETFLNTPITEITISENVRSIGYSAFQNCTNLTSIELPNSVNTIGNRTFYYSGLKDVTLSSRITDIPSRAFGRTQIETLQIPENVRNVGYAAFEGCQNLAYVNLNQVNTIGAYAFANNSNLQEVSIPEEVTYMDNRAFSIDHLRATFEGTLPDMWRPFAETAKVKILCNAASSYSNVYDYEVFPMHDFTKGDTCSRCDADLFSTEITKDDNIVLHPLDKSKDHYLVFDKSTGSIIGESWWQEQPVDVTVPKSIDGINVKRITGEWIEKSAIEKLTLPISAVIDGFILDSLKEFVFTAGNEEAVDYVPGNYTSTPWYKNRKNITSIQFTEGVERIGEYMFAGQLQENYELPKSLKEVGHNAFYRNSRLVSVDMEEGVEKIGYQAFAECEVLKAITLPATLTSIKYNSFAGSDDMVATVYEDTYGHEAAVKYGITYRLSESGPVITPDPNAPVGAIHVGAGYTKAGFQVKVPVELTANPGIVNLKLNLNFDRDALELVGVENGSIFDSSKLHVDTENMAQVTSLFWSDSDLKESIETTGTLAVLTFKVKDAAAEGSYEIRLDCSAAGGAFNTDGDAVRFNSIAGAVNVKPFLYGDINADDDVDINDVIVTKYHIAEFARYKDLKADAVDVDLNGSVNARDLMILERYLAKWSGYNSLPDTRDKLA